MHVLGLVLPCYELEGEVLTLEFVVDSFIVCRWRGRHENLEDYVGSALAYKGDLALIRGREGCDVVHFALLCCRRLPFSDCARRRLPR